MPIPGLDPLIERVLDWTERAVRASRDRKQQRAARLLADAGILLAAMRTLTNLYVEAVGPVRLYGADWPQEKRDEAAAALMKLYDQRNVLPIVEQKRVALEESLALTGRNVPIPSAETELRALIDGANAFVMLLQGDKSDLPWLWEHMNDLGSTNEAEIRQRAHGAMGEFSLRRNRVDAADGAFGRLRAKTLHHYPGLPDPDWAVSIPAPR